MAEEDMHSKSWKGPILGTERARYRQRFTTTKIKPWRSSVSDLD